MDILRHWLYISYRSIFRKALVYRTKLERKPYMTEFLAKRSIELFEISLRCESSIIIKVKSHLKMLNLGVVVTESLLHQKSCVRIRISSGNLFLHMYLAISTKTQIPYFLIVSALEYFPTFK